MDNRELISGTRMLKNARHLRSHAPQLVNPEQARKHGIEVLSPAQLQAVHSPVRVKSTGLSEGQLKALKSATFAPYSLTLDTGLFSGVVHIVDMAFRITGQNNTIFRLSAADLATAIAYTTLAAGPVSQYASQYGLHSVTISQTALVAQVDVPTNQYDNGWVENWVNTIATLNNIPSNDCICILNPPPMVNTDAALSVGIRGFHGKANCPYLFVNLTGSGLAVDDRAFFYASSLSHELAEMIVDPNANISNPEVCDPCAGNCNNVFLNCFTLTGDYLGSVQGQNFSFPFDFFVAAVVQPDYVSKCPAPPITCTYFPEVWSALGEQNLKQIAVAADSVGSLEVFALGKGGAVYNLTQTAGGWSGWTSLLGDQLRQIFVAANDDNRLEVFAIGGDKTVYHIWQTPPNNVWGQWEGLGAQNVSEIAALLDANRILVLFALDGAGAVSVVSQVGTNGLWGNWQPLDGHDLKQLTAAVDNQRRLTLFGLGGDGAVYFRLRDAAGVWAAWGGIPGAKLSQIAVATNQAGSLTLFGTGTDKTAWSCVQDSQSGTWGSWTSVGGTQLKSVIAAPNQNKCLDLFALGGNSRPYHITQQLPNFTWGTWAGLGATQQIDYQQLVPILDPNGKLEVFGLSQAGSVFHISQKVPNGAWS